MLNVCYASIKNLGYDDFKKIKLYIVRINKKKNSDLQHHVLYYEMLKHHGVKKSYTALELVSKKQI